MQSIRGLGIATLLGAAAVGIHAGDLDPPGVPASTPGPEPRIAISQENTPGNEFAHFLITTSGSYYLAENFTASPLSTRSGIAVEASDVTIDLNGFTLDGFNAPSIGLGGFFTNDTLSGIFASGEIENIAVRNGTVRDWRLRGIDLASAVGNVAEDLRVHDNGSSGLQCGEGALVRRCVANSNGFAGISAGEGSLVTLCIADRNEGPGIAVSQGSTVSDCRVSQSGTNGIVAAGAHCRIVDNHCRGNGTSSQSTSAGIALIFSGIPGDPIGGCRVEGNSLVDNEIGISAAPSGNLIVRNSASGAEQNHFGPIASGNDAGTVQFSPIDAGPWDNFVH